jgi:hypothetical protein
MEQGTPIGFEIRSRLSALRYNHDPVALVHGNAGRRAIDHRPNRRLGSEGRYENRLLVHSCPARLCSRRRAVVANCLAHRRRSTPCTRRFRRSLVRCRSNPLCPLRPVVGRCAARDRECFRAELQPLRYRQFAATGRLQPPQADNALARLFGQHPAWLCIFSCDRRSDALLHMEGRCAASHAAANSLMSRLSCSTGSGQELSPPENSRSRGIYGRPAHFWIALVYQSIRRVCLFDRWIRANNDTVELGIL